MSERLGALRRRAQSRPSRWLAAWRSWGLGVTAALISLAALYALSGTFPWFSVYAPGTVAIALGYGLRWRRGLFLALGLLLLISLTAAAISLGIRGWIWGMFYAVWATWPTGIGVLVGAGLRGLANPQRPARPKLRST